MNTEKNIRSGEQDTAQEKECSKKKISSRQIVAMAGIILLVLLYAVTLVVAIVDSSASGRLFWLCLFATIAIPILIWVYTWMYGKLTGRKTMTDPNFNAGKNGTADAANPESPTQTGAHEMRVL